MYREPAASSSAGATSRRATPARKATATKKRAKLDNQTIYRFTNRGPDRNAVVLVFELRRRTKLELVVKGPGPSCEVVARLPVTGKKGTNRVRFAGRPYGRVLPAGAYVLELRRQATGDSLGEVLVGIVAPGTSPVKSEPIPQCESVDRTRPRASLLLAAGPSVRPPATRADQHESTAPRGTDGPPSDVLGDVSPGAQGLPVGGVGRAAGEDGATLLKLVLVALALASALAVAVGLIGTPRRGRPRY